MAHRSRTAGALLLALTWAGSLGSAALAADDVAQSSVYGADSLTFERWCTEIQHLDAARCSARGSADLANYELAKSKLSTFEIEYEKAQRQDREFREGFALYQSPDLGDPLK